MYFVANENEENGKLEVTGYSCEGKADVNIYAEIVEKIVTVDRDLNYPLNAQTLLIIHGIALDKLLNKKYRKNCRLKDLKDWNSLYLLIKKILERVALIPRIDLGVNDHGTIGFVINNVPTMRNKKEVITESICYSASLFRITYDNKIFAEIATNNKTPSQILTEIDEKMSAVITAINKSKCFGDEGVYRNNIVGIAAYAKGNNSSVADNLRILDLFEFHFSELIAAYDCYEYADSFIPSVEHVNQ